MVYTIYKVYSPHPCKIRGCTHRRPHPTADEPWRQGRRVPLPFPLQYTVPPATPVSSWERNASMLRCMHDSCTSRRRLALHEVWEAVATTASACQLVCQHASISRRERPSIRQAAEAVDPQCTPHASPRSTLTVSSHSVHSGAAHTRSYRPARAHNQSPPPSIRCASSLAARRKQCRRRTSAWRSPSDGVVS